MLNDPFSFKRTDPEGCGCTDCLTGFSIPVNQLTNEQIDYACENDIFDASGLTEWQWDNLQFISAKLAFLEWLNTPCDRCHILTCDGFCEHSNTEKGKK